MGSGDYFLEYTNHYEFQTILDIGLGDATSTDYFIDKGKQLTANGMYIQSYIPTETYDKLSDACTLIEADFLSKEFDKKLGSIKFDAIWASHVLEHTRNPGLFLDKIFCLLKNEGVLFLIIPPLHTDLLGGHVTIWTPGLIMYNLILTGFDCRSVRVKNLSSSVAFFLEKHDIRDQVDQLNLVQDFGDLHKPKLAQFFPLDIEHGADGNSFHDINWFQ